MIPTLKNSDIVFFKNYIKGKSLLKVGQLVIFSHPIKGILLIKRIKSVSENSIEVFGENFEFSDDSSKFGLIHNEKVIGIVTSKVLIPQLQNLLSQKKRSTFLEPK